MPSITPTAVLYMASNSVGVATPTLHKVDTATGGTTTVNPVWPGFSSGDTYTLRAYPDAAGGLWLRGGGYVSYFNASLVRTTDWMSESSKGLGGSFTSPEAYEQDYGVIPLKGGHLLYPSDTTQAKILNKDGTVVTLDSLYEGQGDVVEQTMFGDPNGNFITQRWEDTSGDYHLTTYTVAGQFLATKNYGVDFPTIEGWGVDRDFVAVNVVLNAGGRRLDTLGYELDTVATASVSTGANAVGSRRILIGGVVYDLPSLNTLSYTIPTYDQAIGFYNEDLIVLIAVFGSTLTPTFVRERVSGTIDPAGSGVVADTFGTFTVGVTSYSGDRTVEVDEVNAVSVIDGGQGSRPLTDYVGSYNTNHYSVAVAPFVNDYPAVESTFEPAFWSDFYITRELATVAFVDNSDAIRYYEVGCGVAAALSVAAAAEVDAPVATVQTLDYSAQMGTAGRFLLVRPDELKVWVADLLGLNNSTMYQYSMPTAGDLDGATYDSQTFDSGWWFSVPEGVLFGDSGNKIMFTDNTPGLIALDLSTPYDLTEAASTLNDSFGGLNALSGLTDPGAIVGMVFNSAGTRMVGMGKTSREVFAVAITTAWTPSSGFTFVSAYDTSAEIFGSLTAACGTSDGLTFYVAEENGGTSTLHKYVMTTAFDPSTATLNSALDVSALGNGLEGLDISGDDGTLYMMFGDSRTAVSRAAF